jgi:putative protease
MPEVKIGKVSHYFGKAQVAAIELTGNLKLNDKIHIKGHTTDVYETITSIQVEHQSVNEAKAGNNVGIRVANHVRDHDEIFLVTD